MKATQYFLHTRNRPDRAIIQDIWIQNAITNPDKMEVQSDGRIRHWIRIPEMDNRILRVYCLKMDRPFTTHFSTATPYYENQILPGH